MELKMFAAINGLCRDEDGKPTEGFVKGCLNLSDDVTEEEVEKLKSLITPERFLRMMPIREYFSVNDVRMITEEEYEREMGDDDDD